MGSVVFCCIFGVNASTTHFRYIWGVIYVKSLIYGGCCTLLCLL